MGVYSLFGEGFPGGAKNFFAIPPRTTQFFLILDTAIVLVALPSIGNDLNFAPENLSWVVNAYMLTFGGLLMLGGRAADLLGRRRLFMIGLILFAGGTFAGDDPVHRPS